jgi:hypothetical protein
VGAANRLVGELVQTVIAAPAPAGLTLGHTAMKITDLKSMC